MPSSISSADRVVQRSDTYAYVHFADGTWLCFDLAADPTWGTQTTEPAVVLAEAPALLDWQAQHLDRTMTGMLLESGGIGRRPPGSPGVVAGVGSLGAG